MNTSSKYRLIDYLRALLCIAVLLYHLGVVKGGFLAVCAFFTLSGFLTSRSLDKKSFSDLPKHYLNRFIKLYIPLACTVYVSILVISFLKIDWLNLKPESTSVLLGYNNFWQLSANLDYFARHTDSPFMHLWYIAILLQFELVFPIVFLIVKKAGKISRYIPYFLYVFAASGLCGYFSACCRLMSLNIDSSMSLTFIYYNTFTRLFSLFIGVALYYCIDYIKQITVKIPASAMLVVFCICLISIAVMCEFCTPQLYFAQTMILSSLVCALAIICALQLESADAEGKFDKLISFVSGISYEIYLVQYPVIFILKNNPAFTDGEDALTVPAVFAAVIITFILAVALSYALKVRKDSVIMKKVACAALAVICAAGCIKFVQAKDYTEELKALEAQLAENEALMQQRQKDFETLEKQEAQAWADMLAQYENDKNALSDMVHQLPFVALGDSVMLGASSTMYQEFPNCYIEAGISRTAYVAEGYLNEIMAKGKLSDIIIFHYGTNGDAPQRVKDKVLDMVSDKKVYWLNVTNDNKVHVNDRLKAMADSRDNVTLLDWQSYSSGHPEYFGADGIHLSTAGKDAYCNMIYEALYSYCEEKFLSEREAILAQHEAEMRNRIDFFGNDMLASMYEKLSLVYPSGAFVSDKDMNVNTLIERLRSEKEEGTLASRVVLCFDSDVQLTSEDIMNIISVGGIFELNIITTSEATHDAAMADKIQILDSVCVRPFFIYIREHHDYFAPDRKNLSAVGRDAVAAIISENI